MNMHQPSAGFKPAPSPNCARPIAVILAEMLDRIAHGKPELEAILRDHRARCGAERAQRAPTDWRRYSAPDNGGDR